MKAWVARDGSDRNVFVIHLPLELPQFPPGRTRWGAPWYPRLLCRAMPFSAIASRMARRNRGRFCCELPRPYDTFLAFLRDLAFVEGLVCVRDAARYWLKVEIGRCFSPLRVSRAIVECVLEHFYPDAQVEVRFDSTPEASMGKKRGASTV